VISGASDWPVSTANVFWGIYQAETRKGPEGVLDPDQRMPRDAMLYAYTRNSARAMNQLDKIGTIAPGKQADLVLVDRDVMTIPADEMRETKVLWTMVGGKVVWTAPSTDEKKSALKHVQDTSARLGRRMAILAWVPALFLDAFVGRALFPPIIRMDKNTSHFTTLQL
jgi:Amidohydrolase family